MLANHNDICDAKLDMYDANHYNLFDAKYGGEMLHNDTCGDVMLYAMVSTMIRVVI